MSMNVRLTPIVPENKQRPPQKQQSHPGNINNIENSEGLKFEQTGVHHLGVEIHHPGARSPKFLEDSKFQHMNPKIQKNGFVNQAWNRFRLKSST